MLPPHYTELLLRLERVRFGFETLKHYRRDVWLAIRNAALALLVKGGAPVGPGLTHQRLAMLLHIGGGQHDQPHLPGNTTRPRAVQHHCRYQGGSTLQLCRHRTGTGLHGHQITHHRQ